MMRYPRILLKLSGESLADTNGSGISTSRLKEYACEISSVRALGVEVAIVIGGGNIFRGLSGLDQGIRRSKGDQMGMLATVINSLAVSQALEAAGIRSRVFSATPMNPICEYYTIDAALQSLSDGYVTLIGGGTGNPYFTTDSAASLRALELQCALLAKGTRVDGVYDKDPEQFRDAKRFDKLSFDEAYQRQLRIMDLTALTLCQENSLPVVVFNIHESGSLARFLHGESVGTLLECANAKENR